MSYDYDLFTIGAGSGGVRASRVAAKLGARVCVAEAGALGGTCVNVGCVPKKLMVYASEFGKAFSDARGFGWSEATPTFDWPTFLAAKDKEIGRLNAVYGRLLHGSGCDLVRGRARLIDANTVEVEGEEGTTRHTAKHILIATGGRPVRASVAGADRAWTSDDVFSIERLPERLLVVGGGYIAVEMAGIFAGLGSAVTLAIRGPHPLRGFDEDIRTAFTDELRKTGIDVRLHTEVLSLEDHSDGSICAVLPHQETLDVDAALYAIGRLPNTGELGLEAVGVETGKRGAIIVDADYQTTVPGIFALGDVTDRLSLTPVAIEEGIVLANNLFGEGPKRSLDYDHVPTAVFSQPPVATVGLTEGEVPAAHVYESSFRPMKNTLAGNDSRSYMKIVVDPETDRVRGVHLMGTDSAEIIQGFAVALRCGVTKAQLDATVGLHPTAAEELVTMRERRPDDEV